MKSDKIYTAIPIEGGESSVAKTSNRRTSHRSVLCKLLLLTVIVGVATKVLTCLYEQKVEREFIATSASSTASLSLGPEIQYYDSAVWNQVNDEYAISHTPRTHHSQRMSKKSHKHSTKLKRKSKNRKHPSKKRSKSSKSKKSKSHRHHPSHSKSSSKSSKSSKSKSSKSSKSKSSSESSKSKSSSKSSKSKSSSKSQKSKASKSKKSRSSSDSNDSPSRTSSKSDSYDSFDFDESRDEDDHITYYDYDEDGEPIFYQQDDSVGEEKISAQVRENDQVRYYEYDEDGEPIFYKKEAVQPENIKSSQFVEEIIEREEEEEEENWCSYCIIILVCILLLWYSRFWIALVLNTSRMKCEIFQVNLISDTNTKRMLLSAESRGMIHTAEIYFVKDV